MQINMITLKDLKEYDIKNVDIGKFLKTIQQRKDILAGIVLVAITLMTANDILSKERVKTRDLSQKISLLEKKIKAIDSYKKAKGQLTALVKSLPQGLPEADNIIQKVNSLAIDHDLQISSFAPSNRIENDFYNQVNLKLTVSSNDYKNLVLFIKDIEQSPYNLRVELWSAKIERKQKRTVNTTNQREALPSISAELELSSIYFPDEK